MSCSKIATRFAIAAAAVATTVAVGGATSAQADGPGPTGVVQAMGGLNARSAPTTQATKTGVYQRSQTIALYCRTIGTSVGGSRVWYSTNTAGNRWVAGGYVTASGSVPRCPMGGTEMAEAVTSVGMYVRSGPSTTDQVLGSYPSNTTVLARCKVRSQSVEGNTLWYFLDNDSWISARYLRNVDAGPGSNFTPVWCR